MGKYGSKKAGGRDFVKGDPRAGRPKGTKDKVSRATKCTIIDSMIAVEEKHPTLMEDILIRGLHDRSAETRLRYCRFIAEYRLGRPVDRVQVETPQAIVFQFLRGSGDPAEPDERIDSGEREDT